MGEGKDDRINSFFLNKGCEVSCGCWPVCASDVPTKSVVSRSSQIELMLGRRYFWLLHYVPCPEISDIFICYVQNCSTFSQCYKSLSKFGFPGCDNKSFISHKNKKSPRRDKLLSLLQSKNSSGADYFLLVVPLRSLS